MTAQEMFKELGFEKCENCISKYAESENDVIYQKNVYGIEVYIIFKYTMKKVSFINVEFIKINYQMLKCILMQFCELEWLNE